MNIVTTVGIEENKDRVSDGQQSPIISTLEKREEVDHQNIEPISLSLIETIIPITIDVDPKTVANTTDTKIVCSILFLPYLRSFISIRYCHLHQRSLPYLLLIKQSLNPPL